MPSDAGERAIKESLVQLLDSQDKVRGCGLLVDSQHIVTCAHVVALVIPGVKAIQSDKPVESVRVVFPYFMPTAHTIARVVTWKPVTDRPPQDLVEDIAVLRLDRPAPVPCGTLSDADWAGRAFMAHGFPESNPSGDCVGSA